MDLFFFLLATYTWINLSAMTETTILLISPQTQK